MKSDIWNISNETCIACLKTGENLTIEDQLFPFNLHCPLNQVISFKLCNYGQMFSLAVGLRTMLNAIPYLHRSEGWQ